MDKEDILSTLRGLMKKHGKTFSVDLKYITDTGKIKKRHGQFIDFKDDKELYLYNREKKAGSCYQIDRITQLQKLD